MLRRQVFRRDRTARSHWGARQNVLSPTGSILCATVLAIASLMGPLFCAARADFPDPSPSLSGDWLAAIQQSIELKEYEASWSTTGLQAPNRAHNLRTWFEPTGVRVVDRTESGSPELLGLRTVAIGRGLNMVQIGPGVVMNEGARVEIRHPEVVEWYVNSSAGLKQGFTLGTPPDDAGPVVLELFLGRAQASLRGARVVFATPTGRKLTYGELAVFDANDIPLPAHFELPAPDRLRIVFDDHGAAYPVTIDPLLTGAPDAQLESNQANSYLGQSVAGAGDVNGDGYADVIVGAPGYDAGDGHEGAAFIFLGSASGIADGNPTTADTQLESNQEGADFGISVAGAGDVNGDGYADVIVGASFYDAPDLEEGAAFIFLGSATGVADGDPSTAHARLESNQASAQMGNWVDGAGDVNGDGYADVIVGAWWYDGGEYKEGAAFIYHGSPTGIADGNPTTANTRIESNQANALLGVAVAGAGDVNGDGYADVIVGAYDYNAGEDREGAAFIFLGSATGIADGDPATADTRIEGNQVFARLGFGVAGAGDVNGDGYADVIVGADRYDAGELDEGGAFLFLGSAGGIADGDPTTADAQLESNQVEGRLGNSVAGAGDVNGDGYADIIVCAYMYDAGEIDEGAAFLFLGSATGIADGNPSTAYKQLESNQTGALLSRVAGAGDVNGDGYADLIVGSYFYSAGEASEGAAFVYVGGAAGIADGNPATADAQLEPDQGSADMGYSVAGAGDVNGDGYADVIVGARLYDAGQSTEGAAFVFHGSASGIADGNPTTADAMLEGNQANAQMGYSVAGAGDVNGDGYADVIVGAGAYNAGEAAEGAAFIFHGSASGIADGNPATADAQIESNQENAWLGGEVAGAGDVNGDGYADVIVGVGYYDAGEYREGMALIFHGSVGGIASGDPSTADTRIEGNQVEARLGWALACAGDVNGDGYADVIVGSYNYNAGEDREGAAFIFHGSAAGIADGNPATADTQLEGNQIYATMGIDVGGAGDVNGDGYADVIVGANRYDAGQTDEGAAFIFLGSATGIADGNPATAHARFESNQLDGQLGNSVAGAGDVNGDGYSDVIVGAWWYDSGEIDEGAAFIFLGSAAGIANGNPSSADAQIETNQAYARLRSVSGAGDVNGDGYSDVIVGAYQYTAGQSGEGAAFVFLGNSEGRPVLAQQLRGGGGTTPVQPWGGSYDLGEFQIRLNATDPSGRGRVKLETEACPPGVPFGDPGCITQVSADWIDVTAIGAGVPLTETIGGLTGETLYRWRSRVLYAPFSVTKPGITEPPNPSHGPWRRLLGQVYDADVRTVDHAADLPAACCFPTGECAMLIQPVCVSEGGGAWGGSTCDPSPCPPPPTEPVSTAGGWVNAEEWHNWVSNHGEGGVPIQVYIPDHYGEIDHVEFYYSTDGGGTWEFIDDDLDGYEPPLNTLDETVQMMGCGWSTFFEIPDSTVAGPLQFKSVAYPVSGDPIEQVTHHNYDPAPPSMGATNLEDFVVVDLDALGIEVYENGTDIQRIIIHLEPMEEDFTKGIPGISQQSYSTTHCAPTAAAQCLKYFAAQGDTAVTSTLDEPRLVGGLAAYMNTNQTVAGTLPSRWVGGISEWIGDYGDGYTVRYYIHYGCDADSVTWVEDDWRRVRNELERCHDVLLGVFWDQGGGHAITLNSILYPELPSGRIQIGFKDPWTGESEIGELDPATGHISNMTGAGGGGGGQIGVTMLVSPVEGAVSEGGPGDPVYDGLPGTGPPYEIEITLPDPGFWFIHITIVNSSGHSSRITRIIECDPNVNVPADDATRPLAFRLNRCMPNPFHTETEVSYVVPKQTRVALTIHDIAGRNVRTLLDGDVDAGSHAALWNGRDNQGRHVSSGIYYVKMKTSQFEETRKITVLR